MRRTRIGRIGMRGTYYMAVLSRVRRPLHRARVGRIGMRKTYIQGAKSDKWRICAEVLIVSLDIYFFLCDDDYIFKI